MVTDTTTRTSCSPSSVLNNWNGWNDKIRAGCIREYLMHPGKAVWYEICRYLAANLSGADFDDSDKNVSDKILGALTQRLNSEVAVTVHEHYRYWNLNQTKDFLKLYRDCAIILAEKHNILQEVSYESVNQLSKDLNKVVNELGLPYGMALDAACHLLELDIEKAPWNLPVQKVGVSFVHQKDHNKGLTATLEIQAVPRADALPQRAKPELYPHPDSILIKLRSDFGEQIERAKKKIGKDLGGIWPTQHDFRWHIRWHQSTDRPATLVDTSLGLAFYWLLDKAADQAKEREKQ